VPESLITKKALAETLRKLLETKSFEKIAVVDICSNLGINRKSFYYHFKDKYDLVNWIFDYEFLSGVREKEAKDGTYDCWVFISDICKYFYENKDYYNIIFKIRCQNCFLDYFMEVFNPYVEKYLKYQFEEDINHQEFYATFFTDAFLLAVIRWLKNKPDITPEQFIELFKRAVVQVSQKYSQELKP